MRGLRWVDVKHGVGQGNATRMAALLLGLGPGRHPVHAGVHRGVRRCAARQRARLGIGSASGGADALL